MAWTRMCLHYMYLVQLLSIVLRTEASIADTVTASVTPPQRRASCMWGQAGEPWLVEAWKDPCMRLATCVQAVMMGGG